MVLGGAVVEEQEPLAVLGRIARVSPLLFARLVAPGRERGDERLVAVDVDDYAGVSAPGLLAVGILDEEDAAESELVRVEFLADKLHVALASRQMRGDRKLRRKSWWECDGNGGAGRCGGSGCGYQSCGILGGRPRSFLLRRIVIELGQGGKAIRHLCDQGRRIGGCVGVRAGRGTRTRLAAVLRDGGMPPAPTRGRPPWLVICGRASIRQRTLIAGAASGARPGLGAWATVGGRRGRIIACQMV